MAGVGCYGKTPAKTFAESKTLAKHKQLDIIGRTVQVEEVTVEVVG